MVKSRSQPLNSTTGHVQTVNLRCVKICPSTHASVELRLTLNSAHTTFLTLVEMCARRKRMLNVKKNKKGFKKSKRMKGVES